MIPCRSEQIGENTQVSVRRTALLVQPGVQPEQMATAGDEENVSLGQTVHVTEPAIDANVPAAHGTQLPPE